MCSDFDCTDCTVPFVVIGEDMGDEPLQELYSDGG